MDRPSLRVAAVQMVSSYDYRENLDSAERLVAQAAATGAQVVQLPEFFCLLGRRDTDKVAIREAFGTGPVQQHLAMLAKRHQIWLLAGTVPLQASVADKVRNTLLVFDPQGEVAARYDKIHLFSFTHGGVSFDESRTIEPGDTPVGVTIRVGAHELRVGLSVCYDLRFPEFYRALGVCDLMVVPSAFTDVTGQAHWQVLLRARAIENQCYVLAAAQGGLHANGRTTYGHSMLIDPWGEIIAQLDSGEGIVSGDIDFDRLRDVRDKLPALKHRTLF